jgi:hypothetical protein
MIALSRTFLLALLGAVWLGGEVQKACAAAADLDPTFGGTGKITAGFGADNQINAIATQSDGKIVAVGSRYGTSSFAVYRYNSDGSLDTSFYGDGTAPAVSFSGAARAVKIQSPPLSFH